jgi:hypothetical protein
VSLLALCLGAWAAIHHGKQYPHPVAAYSALSIHQQFILWASVSFNFSPSRSGNICCAFLGNTKKKKKKK